VTTEAQRHREDFVPAKAGNLVFYIPFFFGEGSLRLRAFARHMSCDGAALTSRKGEAWMPKAPLSKDAKRDPFGPHDAGRRAGRADSWAGGRCNFVIDV